MYVTVTALAISRSEKATRLLLLVQTSKSRVPYRARPEIGLQMTVLYLRLISSFPRCTV